MKDPLTFLENSIRQLRQYIDNESTNRTRYFDEHLIAKLEKDCKALVKWCKDNENNAYYRSKLTKIKSNGNHSKATDKLELLVLSDFILAYNKLETKEDERSQFVLAYYYDVLKNETFGKPENCDKWNQLVTQPAFHQHLKSIKENHQLASTSDGYLVLSLLTDEHNNTLPFYTTFVNNAFQLNFKNEANVHEFFLLDTKATSKTAALVENDSLEKVMKELNELVGLDNVKKDVSELINLLQIQKKREAAGLHNAAISLHAVFLGPPGTGKTTVARLLARIYKHIGLLSNGQSVETDREGLVAGYVGQTATKVNTIVEESLGGVLFIDEAYSLTQNAMGNDYGAEAINTLLKRMEDHRDNLAVVVAGYTEPMKDFVESNPGLRSRFSRYFFFDHFTPDELLTIFKLFCKKSSFALTPDAEDKLTDTFALLYEKKDDSFGNARVARNIFEKCIQNQANRLVSIKRITKKLLKTLEESDIPDPKETVKQMMVTLE